MYYETWMVVLAVLAPVMILGLVLLLDRLEETLVEATDEPAPVDSTPRAA